MEGPFSPTKPIRDVGFACVFSDGSLTTNHTFLLRDLSEAKMAEVAHRNLDDLERILFWMSRGPLRLLRIGSSVVPFASHASRDFDWKPLVAGRLRAIARSYAPLGFRFSMHPGQYTILNSPNPTVVQAALSELDYACSVLDLMELGPEHKVVVHGGGIYGDREGSTGRLISALKHLPSHIRNRLVLENDERLFTLEQILPVAEAAELPVIFDLHHHQIGPSPNLPVLLERVARTWNCRPKVHLSSQRPNSRPGTHDDLLRREDVDELQRVLPFEADLMVEAKSKEVAALQAWSWINEKGPEKGP